MIVYESDLHAYRCALAGLAGAAAGVWGLCVPAACVYAGVVLG